MLAITQGIHPGTIGGATAFVRRPPLIVAEGEIIDGGNRLPPAEERM
jgi:hypothetical protein